ncbi:NAD(P)H-binding protein [Nocardia cyriacigeorgica]|uniref:NAD(P)H-binding protein n=2 Tax=Nocardia cyriacigeorgica TaxID=135487 RepID=A0A6P1D2M2_9NOCA|nr:NAD(P)H-binding protein [Nocardia cyriacigeorgica]NEW42123.1 NAD(P)H-binding protein [Nocardia cyriacigeorgica]NEW44835.1 NAD(P)H-binding protein [Nocardia cyriacigeorgica]NEW53071.1 NAD(P)H-binding protein [Nocardia cyriacigeorgica]NEW57116.1 NAD(P)H-binding protein [Nocardia cyriacigeorgica]
MTRTQRVLVIGATGHVGGQVVAQLAPTGVAVRALVRDPAAASLPAGVEIAHGDLGSPDTLAAALDRVDSVYMTWPMLSADVADSVVEVIAEHARRIVLLSSAAVRDDLVEQDNPIGRAHAIIEKPLRESGLEWTFLRPHGFATLTLEWAPRIRTGTVVRGAYGAAAMTLLHEADIAAVAVRALTSDGHAGARYELTGPAPLSRVEQVTAIGAALGRPLEWEQITPAQAKSEMEWIAPEYADMILDGLASMVEAPGQPTSTVRDVTGSPARTYAQWVDDHIADFR